MFYTKSYMYDLKPMVKVSQEGLQFNHHMAVKLSLTKRFAKITVTGDTIYVTFCRTRTNFKAEYNRQGVFIPCPDLVDVICHMYGLIKRKNQYFYVHSTGAKDNKDPVYYLSIESEL